jgi:hypothetical protein
MSRFKQYVNNWGRIFIYFFISIFTLNAQKNSWQIVKSPVHSDIGMLAMSTANQGYAAGSSFLKCSNGIWSIARAQPPIVLRKVFRSQGKCMWAVNFTKFYESDLFRFDGSNWKRIEHPLANQITALGVCPTNRF